MTNQILKEAMNTPEYYIEKSIELAKKNCSSHNGGPFGAIVVRNGEIISETGNTVTTTNDPTAHAEVNAIREACRKLQTFDLSDCEIYASCEPCPMCMAAIYWAHIPKLYYAADRYSAKDAGFDDSNIYDELEKPYPERSIKVVNIRPADTERPFEIWKSMSDKIDY